MDQFIVSARKYRPQNFSTVVGQSHITTTLKNAIRSNQLAHAFLFCGPRGVGKTTCARILGKTINCENPTPEGEACNECRSCISFNEGTSLNIHELDAASNNSVDDIRSLVDQVRFAPQAGKYKVYIIDEVHMLSSSAFNAFLKTLEEPPSYAIFILATTEKHKILPTILSRCQIFDFKRIGVGDTVAHLQEICAREEVRAETAALHLIAQKSEGCMRDALSILDKIVSFTGGEVQYQNTLEHLNILDEDYYFQLLEAMLQQNLSEAMLLYDTINSKGFEGDQFLNGFAEFIRNLLVCKDEKAARLLEVVEGFREKYMEAARKADTGYLITILNLLNESEMNFRAARNKRLHVELALIKLCYLRQAVELANAGSTTGKKKLTEGSPVAFRNIQPVLSPDKPTQKLSRNTQAHTSQEEEAKLLVQQAPEGQVAGGGPNTTPVQESPRSNGGPTLGILSKIRQEVLKRNESGNDAAQVPLTPESLGGLWKQYSSKLKEKKNPASQSFERAELRVVDQQNFEVITYNNLEQKFIEQEKRPLCDYLQQELGNRSITFSITVRPQTDGLPASGEKQLSKKEQYLQIAEQYPWVKELKDRLKLELDY
jgi:DNA polymerase-3 subunit gamma/tau